MRKKRPTSTLCTTSLPLGALLRVMSHVLEPQRTCERKFAVQIAATTRAILPLKAILVAVLRRHPQHVQSFLKNGMQNPEDGVHRASTAAHQAHRARFTPDLDNISEEKHC